MRKAKILSTSLLLTSALLVTPTATFAMSVEVVGNGSDSNNTAEVSASKTTEIYQSNSANVSNSAAVKTSTGDNSANANTSGDTSIKTGDANTNLNVNTDVNASKAVLACCDPVSGAVKISGNGADSDNKVTFNLNNLTNITDTKVLSIKNNFEVGANTGDNHAGKNTDGDTNIVTGDANVNVNINNKGNFNEIVLGNVVLPPVPGNGPSTPPVANPGSSTLPTVMGAVNTLPMTGFNMPFRLIAAAVFALISAGVLLNAKASEVELVLSKAARGLKKARTV